ncbi:cadherin domain-containing protein [Roseivirga sp. E12]|uniref:cadherin domain-containing protein n=1 Tax=Roseivirga sp. E12 TaxID=2819237 RepID=UPI001ABD4176|nr:cadherin domain-containing protein [Roseivirga sp. E12]MBO3699288.1 cadherin domain-containing protein [Roseivirga sp. E12]
MSYRFKASIFLLCLSIIFLWNCTPENPAENLPPTINAQEFSASEASVAGDVFGSVSATDAEGDALTFEITVNDNGLFAITSSGQLSLATGQNLDFESSQSHTITVQVSDGTSQVTATITINVIDVDENTMPTISAQSFTVAEDIDDATAIGTVMATDAEGDNLSFSITANDNGLFEITTTGELSLSAGETLDFETTTVHTITVEVSDGALTASAEITINVTDVNENTAPSMDSQEFTVMEDIADDVVIGTVMATDAEGDDLSFSINTNSGDLFEITADGELSLAQGENLDFETAMSHTITVEVTDGQLSTTATITINVTDVDETEYIGTVTTIAGNGGFGFDNGPGLNSAFAVMTGIEVTVTGEILVADRQNFVIRHIDQNLNVTTYAGNGVSGETDGTFANARFDLPTGVVSNDDFSIVYVVDMRNSRIRKLGPGDNVTTVAGSTPGLENGDVSVAQFSVPWDVVIDSQGNLFITDSNNHRIRKIDLSTGQVSTFAGTGSGGINQGGFLDGPGNTARFDNPRGLAIDANDNLYVADTGNNSIRKIDPSGNVTTLAGSGVLGFVDGPGDQARFRVPTGVEVDANGVVYVVDQNNHSIRRVDTNGRVSTIAGDGTFGTTDGVGAAARFGTPEGIAIGLNGELFITDLNNSIIRKIVVSEN